MEHFGRSPQARERLRRVIGKVGVPAVRGAEAFDDARQQKIDAKYGPRSDDYMRLVLARYEDFVTRAGSFSGKYEHLPDNELSMRKQASNWLAQSPSVKSGFLVCGYLLGYGIEAYKKYCQEHGQPPRVDELHGILSTPQTAENTVLKLALMPDPINNAWEDALGIYEGAYEINHGYSFTPLEVVRIKGQLSLRFDIRYAITAIQNSPRGYVAEDHEQCPAANFLPVLWQSLVDESATDPRFFAASLGQTPIGISE